MSTGFVNIVINYRSEYQVSGPAVSDPVVHAMRTNEPGLTACGRRPLSYKVTDNVGQSTTCEKCKELVGEPPLPAMMPRRRGPKPGSHQKKYKPRARKPVEVPDPAYVEQRQETLGKSRCWYITPKGHAALEQMAKEEAAE